MQNNDKFDTDKGSALTKFYSLHNDLVHLLKIRVAVKVELQGIQHGVHVLSL